MENNKQRQRFTNSSRNNLDGFIRPPKKRHLKNNSSEDLSKNPAFKSNVDRMSRQPKFRANAPNSSLNDSILGTTIPSNNSTSPLFGSSNRPKRKIKPPKSLKRKLIVRSIIIVVLIMVAIGGFIGIRGISTLDKVFHGNVFSDINAAFDDKPLKGESSGRVNILLAGDSSDDPGHEGADLTDSILVVSIDTQNHTALMLSIPRDLWVDIPGYGWQKINAANTDLGTNIPGYPKNGMGQLEQIVQTDLGIPIDYYALSDYGAFKDAVNAVGGVTVDIQSPDPRGLYDAYTNLKLPNGEDALNGQEALNLARARGDDSDGDVSYGFPDSDFDRTEHQRQLFTAIADKARTIGVLSNPVKISDLFNAFGNNVETDLTLQNVLRLTQITKGINLSNIKSYSYCSTLTVGLDGCKNPVITTYDDPSSGEEALAPLAGIGNYGQLKQYYDQLTSSNPIIKEGASVVILNASDVDGLAKEQENTLQSKGVYVATIADANNEHPNTMIVDNSKGAMPSTLKLLQKLYPGTTVTSSSGSLEANEAEGYTSDFVVILGQNWDSSTVYTNPQ